MSEQQELSTLLGAFSQDANQLLVVCRNREEEGVVKKQLASMLETMKKIMLVVGTETNVEDLKSAAVNLKNSVCEVFFHLFLFSSKSKQKIKIINK